MSGVVEQAERERYEREYREYLKALIDQELITGAAAGITKQVIDKGEGSLSGGQVSTFDTHVRKPFLSPKCSQCGASLDFSEATNSLDNGGLCQSCEYDVGKRPE